MKRFAGIVEGLSDEPSEAGPKMAGNTGGGSGGRGDDGGNGRNGDDIDDARRARGRLNERLMPEGSRIGRPFRKRNPLVRRVSDADYDAPSFKDFFTELSEGGSIVEAPNFEGILVRMPGNLGELRYRGKSRSGHPTIDVIMEEIPIREVKYE